MHRLAQPSASHLLVQANYHCLEDAEATCQHTTQGHRAYERRPSTGEGVGRRPPRAVQPLLWFM